MEANRKPLVLIVDDEPMNLHVLVEALGHDYRVRAATTGVDALALARDDDKPDLILLDVMIPGMDGYDVCRALKQDEATKGIPVIFITAVGQPEGAQRGLELGAVDYITKPVNISATRTRISVHLKMKQLQDQMAGLASQDRLTGLSNREHFEGFLEGEWRRNLRTKTPLAVIVADIDRFRQFNEANGTAAGDECLMKVAAALTTMTRRPDDLAARYGGEEFAMVLCDTDTAAAHRIAEAFRLGVEKLDLPHSVSPAGRITVSCGVAALVPDDAHSPSDLIALAEKKLRAAKEAGRNTVVS